MKATGINWTGRTLRAAELSGSPRKPVLSRYIEAPIPSGSEAADVLAGFFESNSLSTRKVCVSLGGEGTVVRRLVLPVSNSKAAQRAVRFQAEELLCGESLEDVIVDHEVIGPAAGGGTEVLVLIVKKHRIADALSALSGAGINDGAVTVDGVALFNVASMSGALAHK
ncbi:MAG: hypothetical protein ACYTFG_14930, partial [Planctomycetota bacterium]